MSRHQHISVAVRVRPLEVDPSVTKDASETDNVMMIDDKHIGFVPDISQRIQSANNLRRLATSLAKDAAKDGMYNQIRSSSAGSSRRTPSPRIGAVGGLRRGGALNWPTFVYDHCFGPRECYEAYARTFATDNTQARGTQEDVFNTIGRPAAETVVAGYHCCILAYGQTGSGKTYSMLGPSGAEGMLPRSAVAGAHHRSSTPQKSEPSFMGFAKKAAHGGARDDASYIQTLKGHPQRGLVIRIMEALLEDMCVRSATDLSFCYSMSCSYYQIYKEKAWDLLVEKSGASRGGAYGIAGEPLRLRMNEQLDPYLEGLVEMPIRSVDEMLAVLDLGIRNRRVASTQHNVQSSRSHAILTINLAFGTPKETFRSRLYLVDLAGSERIGSLISSDREHHTATSAVLLSSRNKGMAWQQLKPDEQQWQEAAAAQIAEASDINSSLSALGKVIHVLSEMRLNKNKQAHIPYRDSLLTMVLKNCFGGNAKTFMLATVSPYMRDSEESLSTLRFCSRAKLIVNRPVKNNHRARLVEIEGLRTENAQLRRHVEELEQLLSAKGPDAQLRLLGSSHIDVVTHGSLSAKRASAPPVRASSHASTVWDVSGARGPSAAAVIGGLDGASPRRDAYEAMAVAEAARRQGGHSLIAMADGGTSRAEGNASQLMLFNSPQREAASVHHQSVIAEGDQFRAPRRPADRLEVAGRLSGGAPHQGSGVVRRGTDASRAMSQWALPQVAGGDDDMVEFPDGIDDDELDSAPSMRPHRSFNHGHVPARADTIAPTREHFGTPPPRKGVTSPHQMNSTQPPTASAYRNHRYVSPERHNHLPPTPPFPLAASSVPIGLVSSRPTTPVRHSPAIRAMGASARARSPAARLPTAGGGEGARVEGERPSQPRAERSRRERSRRRRSKRHQSDSSSSSTDSSDEDTDTMQHLIAQLTALTSAHAGGVSDGHIQLIAQARALSPSARNPNPRISPSHVGPNEQSTGARRAVSPNAPYHSANFHAATAAPAPRVVPRTAFGTRRW